MELKTAVGAATDKPAAHHHSCASEQLAFVAIPRRLLIANTDWPSVRI
jgi:hypothetical protein